MSIRRVYNQPSRDDFVVHTRLGLATVRTDHADGTATFGVLSPGNSRGLHLDTGMSITQSGATFTLDAPGPKVAFSTLSAALTGVLRGTSPAYAA